MKQGKAIRLAWRLEFIHTDLIREAGINPFHPNVDVLRRKSARIINRLRRIPRRLVNVAYRGIDRV